MKNLLGALAGLLIALTAFAADPIVTSDLLRLRHVSSIDLAKDGTRGVVVVQSIWSPPAAVGKAEHDEKTKDVAKPKNASHLYRIDLRGANAEVRQLTFGDRNDGDARISPDGRRVVFTRRAGDSQQLWLLPLDGGEARQLTRLERGAGAPIWSPDGRTVVFRSSVLARELPGSPPWASERSGVTPDDGRGDETTSALPDGSRREIRRWLGQNAKDRDPVVIDRIDFQGETALEEPLSFGQLFRLAVDDPHAIPERLTEGFRGHGEAVFVPDGRALLFSATRSGTVHPDRIIESSLFRLPLDGGPPVEFLAPEGWSVRSPTPGPDGSVIAFLGRQSDQPTYRPWQAGIVTVVGDRISEPVWLTEPATFDHSVRDVAWLPARSSLLLSAPVRGGVPLFTMELGLLEPAPLIRERDGRPVGVQAFAAASGVVVYAETSAANPCTLRVNDTRGDRLVVDLNEWIGDRELSLPESRQATSKDGTKVDYWLMPPTRRVIGREYPLAVEIHGGPSAMWGPGERTMWLEFQLLCSWGYGVVYANPRGSGGYGYTFKRANYQNWGAGPAEDVLAAVDAAVNEDWVDPERLVVTGGSYGGYLTAWIVGHDNRFKAAVAQRGVYDLRTFFGEGNAWRLVPWDMGGYPWEPRIGTVLDRESPFTSVNRIRTPLLIMHASDDLRTGVSQSEMLFRALKQLERPVEYVRYPDAGHDLSRSGDPTQRMDRLNRIVEFFERFIHNDRPAPRPRLSSESASTP